jgi:hypothetical protein
VSAAADRVKAIVDHAPQHTPNNAAPIPFEG